MRRLQMHRRRVAVRAGSLRLAFAAEAALHLDDFIAETKAMREGLQYGKSVLTIRFVHNDTTSDVTVRKHSADPGICMGYVRDGKCSAVPASRRRTASWSFAADVELADIRTGTTRLFTMAKGFMDPIIREASVPATRLRMLQRDQMLPSTSSTTSSNSGPACLSWQSA